MMHERDYQVLLLPSREVAAAECTLAEAVAWMRSYNAAGRTRQRTAVIGQATAEHRHRHSPVKFCIRRQG